MAERGLRLDVVIARIEQDAEVGVVLDLAAPFAEPEHARLDGAHRLGTLLRPVEDEQGIGERRDEVDLQLVGRPTRLAGDRRQTLARRGLGGDTFGLLGERVGASELGIALLERVHRERLQQVEALEMRRAAETRLQMRPMRPAQQLEGAAPVPTLVAGDAGGQQQQRAFLGPAARRRRRARPAATSQGKAFKASPASRQCWATCAGSTGRASR
jgi:hypothetical protein